MTLGLIALFLSPSFRAGWERVARVVLPIYGRAGINSHKAGSEGLRRDPQSGPARCSDVAWRAL